jgi:ubiquinone/menaquinone biosynthesis C-methylase UbiE
MNQADLNRAWDARSHQWITMIRAGKSSHRVGLLDDYMLEACGDVTGLHILDCGCGEGRFSRMLAARGAAAVLGLDVCAPMIEAAQALQSAHDSYQVADVQDLSFLPGSSFDLAVSYLNQSDLPDFVANTRAVYRILRPGGRFVIVNIHPMRSAAGQWHRTPDGAKDHVIVDRYFDEGIRQWEMLGGTLTNFHRTLTSYLHGFLQSGFALEWMIEPMVNPDQLATYPDLDDELRVPNFILYRLRKPVC